MTAHIDRGEPDIFEITWRAGHVERIKAHQVTYPMNVGRLFMGRDDLPEIVEFHGETDGRWRLVLHADVADIRTIRNVTRTESELA